MRRHGSLPLALLLTLPTAACLDNTGGGDSQDVSSALEQPNGQLPADPIIEEVQGYGQLDSKMASMAALHRIPGSRAEVAMLSLSRGYFGNCRAHGGVRFLAGHAPAGHLRGELGGKLRRALLRQVEGAEPI